MRYQAEVLAPVVKAIVVDVVHVPTPIGVSEDESVHWEYRPLAVLCVGLSVCIKDSVILADIPPIPRHKVLVFGVYKSEEALVLRAGNWYAIAAQRFIPLWGQGRLPLMM